ncbi:carbohydrate-binding protein [candidate division KSB1 bacterium]|nr:carbohydrate-binding protein [candidate division KSB1 bacterium]
MFVLTKKVILFFICTVLIFSSIVQAQKITISGIEFRVGGNRIWMNGANTPWNSWNDFGGSFDYNWWNNHFQELQDNGINSTRIWFSCNGDVAPTINSSGYVTDVPQAFWDDCDQLFQIAQSKGIYVMATVISFDHFKSTNATGWRNMVGSQATIQSFIDVYLLPFVNRYESNPYFFSVDLCNEMEWVHEDAANGQLPWIDLQRYTAMCAAAIHQNSDVLVTTGSACIKWGSDLYEGNFWSNAALQAAYSSSDAYLDYYHVHYYGWQHEWFSSPFELSPADYQINDRPVVVGECPAQDMSEIPVTITQALENALSNGYQGTFPWTSNGVDANGSLTTLGPATTSFKNNHYALVYPSITPNDPPSVSITSPSNGATFTAPANVTITANASDSDGSIALVEFFNGSTKLGEDSSSPYQYTWNSVAVGNYSLTARATDNDAATTTSSPISITVEVASSQAPYGGTPVPIPGTIEAEDYDTGGEGLAYHDADVGNSGSQYRSEDVDIEVCGEGGYNVGWISADEWLEYTVDVASTGNYDLEMRIARSPTGSSSLHVESDGNDVTGIMSVPSTGDWQSWTSINQTNVYLTAGEHVLRIYMDGGDFNLNRITFTSVVPNQPPSVSITSPSNGATFTEPASIPITADASDSDGSITLVEFYNSATKLGEDSSSPYQYTWNSGAVGNYSLTARATDNDAATTTSSPVNITVEAAASQSPYSGTPAPIPGTIQAEDYDTGGEGLAYHDTDTENSGGEYRSEGVDIEVCGEGGYNVGWINADEWLEYTINVASTGTYDLEMRIARSPIGSSSLHVESDGNDVTGIMTVPSTGGWQTWTSINQTGVSLTAGQHVLRIYMDGGSFNLNRITFTSVVPNQPPSVSITSPSNGTTFTEPADITITADASDSDGSITLVEFFNGATKLGEDSSSPYLFNWNSIGVGNYSLTARATDDDDATTTSNPVNVTVEAGSSGGGTVAIAGSWTSGTSHTAESGLDRLLVLTAHVEHSGAVSLNSVNYGGQSMTMVVEQSANTGYVAYTAVFVLNEAGISAASGNTFSASWSTSTAQSPGYSSVFLTGVNQSSPIGSSDGNSSTVASASTSALSTTDGDMVLLAATCGNTGTYSTTNGFMEAIELGISSSDGIAGYIAASGSDETPGVTHSSVNRQSIVGLVVQAGSSSSGGPTNLISNGEFDNGTTDWGIDNNGGATAVVTAVTDAGLSGVNAAQITMPDGGTENWHVQFEQVFGLESGKTYEITFMAKADASKQIQLTFQQTVDPYANYWVNSGITIGTSAATYGPYTYNCDVSDSGAKFKFHIGGNTTTIYIDNIVITEVGAPKPIAEEEILASADQPNDFMLRQNYPNPFNPTTEIAYNLPEAVHVKLEVFDITGRRVKTLVDFNQSSGQHEVLFDARDLTTGTYIYRINAGSFYDMKKMILIK